MRSTDPVSPVIVAVGLAVAAVAADGGGRATPWFAGVAGGGTAVEGRPATECRMTQPFGVAFGPRDDMFICQETHRILLAAEWSHLIRKFHIRERRLVTIAGSGVRGAEGVPGDLLAARLAGPHGVVVQPRSGAIFIADSRNHRVLRIRHAATGDSP